MHLLLSNLIISQFFCSSVFEHHFLAFHFSWAVWFPQLKFHDPSSFQIWTKALYGWVYVYVSQILLFVISSISFDGAENTCKNPVTNARKFWRRIFLISVSHAHAQNSPRVWSFSSNLRSLQTEEASARRLFYSRIKGLASGTEMTGRELHHFFHFDMPPYLVILLLSINIVVIANECNNWLFLLLGGQ